MDAYVKKNMYGIYGNKYQMIDDEVYQRQVFHKFRVGDTSDPDIYVIHNIYDWLERTEKGKWVHEHVKDLQYQMFIEPEMHSHQVVITGMVSGRHWTYFLLKYNDTLT